MAEKRVKLKRFDAKMFEVEKAERRVKLKSSDDEMFEVDEAVAFESQVVKKMIEDTGMDDPIPLPNVSSEILAKVIEYCKYHVDNQKPTEDEIKAWDLDFVKVNQATLFDLILAANYLNIKTLLDVTCETVADTIKGKTLEEIHKTFNIKDMDSVFDALQLGEQWALVFLALRARDI